MRNIDLLKSTGIFAQITEEDLQKIESLLRERVAGPDEVVCRQGDAGNALYIVQSGRIRSATTDAVGRERTVGFFTDGQSFGDMALLTGEPFATTAQAVADSRLLVLRKDDFDGFLTQNVQVMLHMMKVIADRQAQTTVRTPRMDEMSAAAGPGNGRVFTVFSPKGGVGKSTIAVNLAVALAHQNRDSVVLVDLALTFGHDLLLLNLTTKSSLSATTGDALKKMGLAEGLGYYLALHEPSSLRVLPGSTRPEDGETVTGETARVAIEQLRRHFAYVVVDTSSTFSDPVLAALELSDRVVILCSPEMAMLRDLRECQRIFNTVVHLSPDKVLYTMNHVLPVKGLSREQFEDALQQPLYMELPNGGDTPMKASLRGEAFVETQTGSSIAKAVQKLGAQLVAETASRLGIGQPEKKRGLFGR